MNKEIIENLENEHWVENNGYKISDKGRIIGKKGKLLKFHTNWCGYLMTNVIFEDGFHARSVHRAVAYAFIPNDDPINKIEVNHIDGNKENNKVDNLEWVTKKENQEHEAKVLKQRNGEKNYLSYFTDEQVIEIYNLCKNTDMKHKDIAEMYHTTTGTITKITRGLNWKHLGLEPILVIRGSRSRGKKVTWINENKTYTSMSKCSDDLRNTYNIIVNPERIKDICEGKLDEWKGQQFKWAS